MGSDAERSALPTAQFRTSGIPVLSRGLSDFDTTHLITVDWSYAMPFGNGKALLGNSGKLGECNMGRLAMGRTGSLDQRTALLGDRAGMDHKLGRFRPSR